MRGKGHSHGSFALIKRHPIRHQSREMRCRMSKSAALKSLLNAASPQAEKIIGTVLRRENEATGRERVTPYGSVFIEPIHQSVVPFFYQPQMELSFGHTQILNLIDLYCLLNHFQSSF